MSLGGFFWELSHAVGTLGGTELAIFEALGEAQMSERSRSLVKDVNVSSPSKEKLVMELLVRSSTLKALDFVEQRQPGLINSVTPKFRTIGRCVCPPTIKPYLRF